MDILLEGLATSGLMAKPGFRFADLCGDVVAGCTGRVVAAQPWEGVSIADVMVQLWPLQLPLVLDPLVLTVDLLFPLGEVVLSFSFGRDAWTALIACLEIDQPVHDVGLHEKRPFEVEGLAVVVGRER